MESIGQAITRHSSSSQPTQASTTSSKSRDHLGREDLSIGQLTESNTEGKTENKERIRENKDKKIGSANHITNRPLVIG